MALEHSQVSYHLSRAWSKFNQQSFTESWDILTSTHVLESALLTNDVPSKSILLLLSQAYHLKSLLAMLSPQLSPIAVQMDQAPMQAAYRAVETGYTAMRCYVTNAVDHDWEFDGQEWHVVGVFLTGALHLARLCAYSAAPREARCFIKRALDAAQKHALVVRYVLLHWTTVILCLSVVSFCLRTTLLC